ncbi:GntR family transcriptional regulator [Caproiciproducens sp.]|uniref:GntR family transcriptional regulator n=1 Tax=Caproiciproducens sp. TaxID=1954376 RepID=UPI00289B4FD7|nr:GntR family transcriptional regulator [Caproiciproducens sp.]
MIDKTSLVPMYDQVKDDLIQLIRNGEIQVGEKIDSESEICEKYGVSRITAKRALNEMVNEGYINRIPGRGSFVTDIRISHMLSSFYSFTEEIKRLGMTPSDTILNFDLIVPQSNITDFFHLPKGEKVLYIRRQRLANNEVIALDHSYIHPSVGSRFTREQLQVNSLYTLLALYDALPDRAVESFTAESVNPKDARLLMVEKGSAALKVERKTYCKDRPIEYNYRYYKGNKYIYTIELK